MPNKDDDLFDDVKGVESVDPSAVEEFVLEMTNNAIPEIVEAIEERRLAAAATRGKPLKY